MKYRNSRICGTSPCLGLKPTKNHTKSQKNKKNKKKKNNKIDSENSPFENILKVHAESENHQFRFSFSFHLEAKSHLQQETLPEKIPFHPS